MQENQYPNEVVLEDHSILLEVSLLNLCTPDPCPPLEDTLQCHVTTGPSEPPCLLAMISLGSQRSGKVLPGKNCVDTRHQLFPLDGVDPFGTQNMLQGNSHSAVCAGPLGTQDCMPQGSYHNAVCAGSLGTSTRQSFDMNGIMQPIFNH